MLGLNKQILSEAQIKTYHQMTVWGEMIQQFLFKSNSK